MSNLSQTYREGGGSHACDKYLSVCPIIFTRTHNDITPQPGHSHGLELIHCGFPTFVFSEAAHKRYHKIRRLRRMKCLSRCWHKDFRSPSSPPAAAFCFLAVAVKMSACWYPVRLSCPPTISAWKGRHGDSTRQPLNPLYRQVIQSTPVFFGWRQTLRRWIAAPWLVKWSLTL